MSEEKAPYQYQPMDVRGGHVDVGEEWMKYKSVPLVPVAQPTERQSLPCPFCGSTFLFDRSLEPIHCRDCGARGPVVDDGYDTFEDLDHRQAWNTRAAAQVTALVEEVLTHMIAMAIWLPSDDGVRQEQRLAEQYRQRLAAVLGGRSDG